MIKSNLFGLLINRSPLVRLVEAHVIIKDSVIVVNETLDSFAAEGRLSHLQDLESRTSDLKSQAERMIRSIKNSLPNCILMPINKNLILDYACIQEQILNAAQEGLYWLCIKKVPVTGEIRKDMVALGHEAMNMASILGSILEETVSQVHLESLDREEILDKHEMIQERRKQLRRSRLYLDNRIYGSRMDFRDIYPLIHFTSRMSSVSRSCAKSAEILRSMIAR
jgi:uncharacterized protein